MLFSLQQSIGETVVQKIQGTSPVNKLMVINYSIQSQYIYELNFVDQLSHTNIY